MDLYRAGGSQCSLHRSGLVLGKHAGAGTLVPITGFANGVVSSAIEARTEGWVLGIGTRIFAIAGPVILYGTSASMVYGLIYYFWTLFR